MSGARASGRAGSEGGFTLMEVVLTIAVMAVVGIGLSSVMLAAAEAQVMAINLAETNDSGSIASQWIYYELREVQAPISVGLRSMPGAGLDFLDWNGNGYVYTVANGSLLRSFNGGAAQPLTDGVVSFTVVYRAENGTPAASASLVKRIDFALVIRRGDVQRRFGGQVWPRGNMSFVANWREE